MHWIDDPLPDGPGFFRLATMLWRTALDDAVPHHGTHDEEPQHRTEEELQDFFPALPLSNGRRRALAVDTMKSPLDVETERAVSFTFRDLVWKLCQEHAEESAQRCFRPPDQTLRTCPPQEAERIHQTLLRRLPRQPSRTGQRCCRKNAESTPKWS